MNIIYQPGGKILRGVKQSEDLSYAVVETPTAQGGTTLLNVAIKDVLFTQTDGAGTDNNFRIMAQPSFAAVGPATFSVVASSTGICTVDSAGNVARTADGSCAVNITSGSSSKQYSRSMVRSSGATVYQQTGHTAGSLSAHVATAIDMAISGKQAGIATQNIFNGANYSTTSPSGTRNPGLFSALDFSASSFAVSSRNGSAAFPVHLISSRHIIFATHIGPGVGNTITWLGADNMFRSAALGSIAAINGPTDVSIGYLSAPITGISPYKVFPSTYRSQLPLVVTTAISSAIKVPVLSLLWDGATNQTRVCIIPYMRGGGFSGSSAFWTDVEGYASGSYAPWSSAIAGGDSGSGIFFPLNGAPILVAAFYAVTFSSGIAAMYSDYISTINAAMNTLATAAGDPAAGTYALSHPDLSGFTSY